MPTGATLSAEEPLSPLIIAAWAQLPWLVHGFSTRAGGTSMVYRRPRAVLGGDLNLGFTAEDAAERVLANRRRLIAHLVATETPGQPGLVTVRQVHSTISQRVNEANLVPPADRPGIEGDALMTDTPGILLGILTADCVPVLVVDPTRRAVAAFHAGWRGTVGRIVEHGIERMRMEFGSQPGDLLAAIGPAIGPCCYSVGDELRQAFTSQFTYADELFQPPASPTQGAFRSQPRVDDERVPHAAQQTIEPALRLDLAKANRRQLMDAGVEGDAISMTGACTSCDLARFFSHRGEKGVTGRMMAVIGVRQV